MKVGCLADEEEADETSLQNGFGMEVDVQATAKEAPRGGIYCE